MRLSVSTSVGAVVLFFAATGVASAVAVTESGDAGSLPSNAQTTTGAVDLITGTISRAEFGTDSDEDLYRICLTGGRTFSADTQGSQLDDPQLFLFDASGRGIYADDDFNGLQSRLPAGDPLTPSAAGVYYLGISAFANRPTSVGGEIFQFGTRFPILEPIGPGGSSPVTGWNELGLGTGAYRVALTGTRACAPTTKEECKNGGWRNFPGFKNQGDCVSFVATGGKNPPANQPR
jgi:hypothetical protein